MRAGRWQLVWIVAVSAMVAVEIRGQTLSITEPEKVGLSSSRLERIEANLEELVRTEKLAGAVTLVARRGQVAYLQAAGWQDKENRVPMKTDAVFRIASMTKPITSVAVMMLYEEGHFRLQDPVSKFIPEFKNVKVLSDSGSNAAQGTEPKLIPPKQPITIHHLLAHTSGLTYHWDDRVGKEYREAGVTHGLIEDQGVIGDNVKKLAKIPLVQQPGEKFNYGLNTDVVGYLVEVVSGMTLDEFFQRRIFEPLEMKDTKFFLAEDESARLAKVYLPGPGGSVILETREQIAEGNLIYSTSYPVGGPKSYFSGGGGLCSTASDYFRFCQMLLDNGRYRDSRLLSRKTVELITSPHVSFPGTEIDMRGFGLGFAVQGPPGRVQELGSAGTYGWGGFFYTVFFIDPREQLIGISMAQLHPSGGLDWNDRFSNLVYQAIDD